MMVVLVGNYGIIHYIGFFCSPWCSIPFRLEIGPWATSKANGKNPRPTLVKCYMGFQWWDFTDIVFFVCFCLYSVFFFPSLLLFSAPLTCFLPSPRYKMWKHIHIGWVSAPVLAWMFFCDRLVYVFCFCFLPSRIWPYRYVFSWTWVEPWDRILMDFVCRYMVPLGCRAETLPKTGWFWFWTSPRGVREYWGNWNLSMNQTTIFPAADEFPFGLPHGWCRKINCIKSPLHWDWQKKPGDLLRQ